MVVLEVNALFHTLQLIEERFSRLGALGCAIGSQIVESKALLRVSSGFVF